MSWWGSVQQADVKAFAADFFLDMEKPCLHLMRTCPLTSFVPWQTTLLGKGANCC